MTNFPPPEPIQPDDPFHSGLTDYIRGFKVGDGQDLPIELRASIYTVGRRLGYTMRTAKVDAETCRVWREA